MEQRRAATHDQLPIVWIDDRQRPRTVGVKSDLLARNSEEPRLAVVARRREDRKVEEKLTLLFRRDVGRKRGHRHAPRIVETHCHASNGQRGSGYGHAANNISSFEGGMRAPPLSRRGVEPYASCGGFAHNCPTPANAAQGCRQSERTNQPVSTICSRHRSA